MRGWLSKYEVEIRLGLVVIVLLLLLLNISTSFVFYRVKRQLTEKIDSNLQSALDAAILYINRTEEGEFSSNQEKMLKDRFHLTLAKSAPVKAYISRSANDSQYKSFPLLTLDEISRLRENQWLYKTDGATSSRFGIGLVRLNPGIEYLVMIAADGTELKILSNAARQTVWIAIGVLILILPLTILMPRFILKPFREMRRTASKVGRAGEFSGNDEVADAIKSYEQIITKLTESEAELRRLYQASAMRAAELERFNHYILSSIGSGVITVDLDGKVIGYNQAARDILGYDVKDILNQHYVAAFPQEMELSLLIEAGLERGEATGRRDIELNRLDESRLWLGVESSIIYDDDGRVVGVTLLFNDKTEFIKLQTELEMNRRMAALGEMTGGLAHQLRNSLAAVSGFCQLLMKKVPSESDINQIACSIREENKTSSEMVSRFLNFSKPLKLNSESLDLVELVDNCREKVLQQYSESQTEILVRHDPEGVPFVGDSLLLKEAIGNLFDNSMQALEGVGRIDVIITADDKYVGIRISDNGPGIPDNIRENIFTPFVSSKPSGTGLGLALTRKIIHMHQGTILFDTNPGGGTICHIRLPMITTKEGRLHQFGTVKKG